MKQEESIMESLFGCWVTEDYQQKGGKGRLRQTVRSAVMGKNDVELIGR